MPGVDARNRLIRIAIAIALMASFEYVFGESVSEGTREATLPPTGAGQTPSIPVESGVFRLAPPALAYQNAAWTETRTLAGFYTRRAYPGAPPVIPHPTDNDQTIGGRDCLRCHGDGGYVPKFGAFSPVVPHPELVSCRQCHVSLRTEGRFRATNWSTVAAPPIGGAALPGGPPPIPHRLQMRENCLACHTGPGAVVELHMDHPERVNCRQCHAATDESGEWTRPTPENPR